MYKNETGKEVLYLAICMTTTNKTSPAHSSSSSELCTTVNSIHVKPTTGCLPLEYKFGAVPTLVYPVSPGLRTVLDASEMLSEYLL